MAASAQQLPDAEMRAYLKNTIAKADSFHDRFDAEVWLVDMSGRLKRYVKDHKKRLEILRLVHKEASQAGLQPELVLSVIHVESLFNHFAISRVGAQGLMQVMPFWKKEIGRPNDNLTDIATNIRYGCTILSYYLKKEKGNLTRALARYNGSLGKTWYPSRVFTAWNRFWQAR
ncbi:transglycosylase SLT domain-containing protein [Spartinivicinus marinus]|uniref:transglycosylase SLT domain-containing protein n=1 Tax=Spartinivicinus marinus TaxID=2994442 RepID=UPI003EBF1F47